MTKGSFTWFLAPILSTALALFSCLSFGLPALRTLPQCSPHKPADHSQNSCQAKSLPSDTSRYTSDWPSPPSTVYLPVTPPLQPICLLVLSTSTSSMSYHHGTVEEPIRAWRWLGGGICTILVQPHPMLPHPPLNNMHTIPYSSLAAPHTVN